MHRRTALFVTTLALLIGSEVGALDSASDEAAIRAVDAQMLAAGNARDVEGWLGYLADNASMMPPNAPAVVGKAAIRQFVLGMLESPSVSIVHHPATIEVSRSGDLAYIHYAYEITVKDATGRAVTEKGKDISIFKKIGGSWKLVVDIWSPDTAAAATP